MRCKESTVTVALLEVLQTVTVYEVSIPSIMEDREERGLQEVIKVHTVRVTKFKLSSYRVNDMKRHSGRFPCPRCDQQGKVRRSRAGFYRFICVCGNMIEDPTKEGLKAKLRAMVRYGVPYDAPLSEHLAADEKFRRRLRTTVA